MYSLSLFIFSFFPRFFFEELCGGKWENPRKIVKENYHDDVERSQWRLCRRRREQQQQGRQPGRRRRLRERCGVSTTLSDDADDDVQFISHRIERSTAQPRKK